MIKSLLKYPYELFLWILQKLPGILGIKLRKLVYSKMLKGCGVNIHITENVFINKFQSITIGNDFSINRYSMLLAGINDGELFIGNNCYIGCFCIISSHRGTVRIGNNVMLANGVLLEPANHRFDDLTKPMRLQGHNVGRIIIEDDVWIGDNCVILKDVKIGRGSVIGAGSVVTKDVEPYSVVGGVPAKLIKKRI